MNSGDAEKKPIALMHLSPREMSSQLMALPVKERLKAIFEREDAAAVVRAISPQDLFFTVKELGKEDSIPLLALASVEQINHVFGLEWWRKDEVQPAKALEWLDLLAGATSGKVLEWLYQADFELLVSLFKKWIRVVTPPEDIDPVEARDYLPVNTLDDQYYWDAVYPQYEESLKALLSLIFEVSQGFYGQLMHHILWASEAEMDEAAYRFNRGRLEDEAIPDFYDSLEIYRAISPNEILPSKSSLIKPREESSPVPSFALVLLPPADLLGCAIREIRNHQTRDIIQVELASLANKLILADQLSLDHPETLRQAVDKAAAYVNLGLDLMTDGTPSTAIETLKVVFLEQLFRLGYTEVARIRNRLQRIVRSGWLSKWPHGLRCLDPEWMESAELLLARTPRILRSAPYMAASTWKSDHIRKRSDLLLGEQLVRMIESVGVFHDALDPDLEHLKEKFWAQGQARDLEEVTIGIMILTAIAGFIDHGQRVLEPIPLSRWPRLFHHLEPEVLRRELRAWIDMLFEDSLNRRSAEDYLQPILQAYDREIAPFVIREEPPDPRFVRFFLFTET